MKELTSLIRGAIAKRMIKKMTALPRSSKKKNRERAVLRAVKNACRRVPVYQRLYALKGIRPHALRNLAAFHEQIPCTGKKEIFGSGAFSDFCSKRYREKLITLYTSSGSSDRFSFGTLSAKDRAAGVFFIEEFLFRLYGIGQANVLVVNCLSLGTEIPLAHYPVARTGMRSDSVIEVIKRSAGEYKTIALAGEPLFLKRVIEEGIAAGVPWEKLRVFVFTGGEYVSEYWRRYMSRLLGQDAAHPGGGAIIVTMGVTEIGLGLFFETFDLMELRRRLTQDNGLKKLIVGAETKSCPLIMHYLPDSYYLEALPGSETVSELCVTTLDTDRLIPLIRYRTGDEVVLSPPRDFDCLCAHHHIGFSQRHLRGLPVGLVRGLPQKILLSDGDWISPNEVKDALFMDCSVAGAITGNFKLLQNQRGGEGRLQVQLMPGKSATEQARDTIAENLRKYADPPVEIEFFSFREFPDGFGHDYERKNKYLG
jgi:phenylacetate-coenzyme A ligase PaaK-like adenylate-forming protein